MIPIPMHSKATTLSITEKRQTTLQGDDDFFTTFQPISPGSLETAAQRDSIRRSRFNNTSDNINSGVVDRTVTNYPGRLSPLLASPVHMTMMMREELGVEARDDDDDGENNGGLQRNRPSSFIMGSINQNMESHIKFESNLKAEEMSKKSEVNINDFNLIN